MWNQMISTLIKNQVNNYIEIDVLKEINESREYSINYLPMRSMKWLNFNYLLRSCTLSIERKCQVNILLKMWNLCQQLMINMGMLEKLLHLIGFLET
jgi:hypothetical protein